MKRYKITVERNECIGAGPCTAILPEFWTLNEAEDGRVNISKKHEPMVDDQGNEWVIVKLSDEELKEHIEAAESCPVAVIHIIEEESGKKII